MTGEFETYLRDLAATPLRNHTEHTGRSALEVLLKAFAAKAASKGILVQHEPKRQGDKGAPDFKVEVGGQTLGYLEVKKVGAALDDVLESAQIKKYLTLSSNLILTDYLEWIWLRDGRVNGRATLAYPNDLAGKIQVNTTRAAEVDALLAGFFSTAPQGIGKAADLAKALAVRARLLRAALAEELIRQEKGHTEGKLFGLLGEFRTQVFHELSIGDFADAFAQMLAYGLFLARLNAGAGKAVTLANADGFIPGSFALIKELVEFLAQLNQPEYDDMRWIVDEILSIVNGLDLTAIHADLSFQKRKAISRKVRARDAEEHRLFERDPFIYFYEDFLKEYDPAMRKGRGVYYTPPPVVNFIVRAVDDILKDSFGIADGLADHQRVTVLDFACGTGTFLLEVFQRIFENIGGADKAIAGKVVREHITRNLYGFEYLIAPYTIAHLKLSQYLKDQGHDLKPGERLQIYLTNTLEPIAPQGNFLLPKLSEEADAAQKIKEQPILVILGNPPYSGHSKNKGEWITAAIDGYKFTVETDAAGREVEKPLGERNPKWLNDDYVKFLRFAQLKMDAVLEGVVGVITNHSWLDNPTFRGMRQSLMRSFDQIYAIDLHGSAKRREHAPDGSEDENVFDIQQGVAIALFVKKQGIERGTWRGDLWGRRLEKYAELAGASLSGVSLTQLSPVPAFYLFAEQPENLRAEYDAGWGLTEIFPVNVLGFQTHRDRFAISFTEAEMRAKLADLSDAAIADDVIAARYGLRSNRDWSLAGARLAAQAGPATAPRLVGYRPFDNRWAEFGTVTMDYPRRELMEHVAGKGNLCLLSPRSLSTQGWRHALVSDKPPNDCVISSQSREANQVFPLWIYAASGATENLAYAVRTQLDAAFQHHYSAEEILGYIYAVLHAPTYHRRYAEFLRIDFPRVSFPDEAGDFEALSRLGWAMVEAHLLRASLPRRGLADYVGRGDDRVEAVRRDGSDGTVWINAGQGFRPVPAEVWDFHIGGYRVLDKYLKSRKGRVLSLDEIRHVARICDALAFTIEQMARIDAAYLAAFPEQIAP